MSETLSYVKLQGVVALRIFFWVVIKSIHISLCKMTSSQILHN